MAIIIDFMVEKVWKTARTIILSWREQASEVFILDLPLQDLPRVLTAIRDNTSEPTLLRYDGSNLSVEQPLSPQLFTDLHTISDHNTVHSVRGWVGGRVNLYFYLWIDAIEQTLEVEMVFWNDSTFPASLTEDDHKQMLGQLLRIAHEIRGENHHSPCILSAEYNSEPRELLRGHANEVAIW